MKKGLNRQRRRPKKAASEDAGPQPPPLQPAYPGMGDEPAEAAPVGSPASPETQPVAAETQPEEVSVPAKPSRRRKRSPKQMPEPAPISIPPAIEPGTATGEAAELVLPEIIEEPLPQVAEPAAMEPAPQSPAAIDARPGKKPRGAVVLAIGLP